MLKTTLPGFPCCAVLLLTVSALHAQDREVYFGLLHSHTHFSDGEGTPDEAYTMAKDAGCDFFAITEHNHSQAAGSDSIFLTPTLYHELKQTARDHTVDGEFVAIWGQEVSTISKGNHVNIFFASEICNMPNGDFKFFYENWMPSHLETKIVQLNHPKGKNDTKHNEYGIDDYDQDFDALVAASDRYVKIIEVIKGSSQSDSTSLEHRNGIYADDYFFYLNKGFHIGPSVGGDNHKKTWGKSMHGRMGVWATELSESGIEEAIAKHHCYASEDDNIEVQFTVNDAIMGSSVEISTSSTLELKVTFDDPAEASARHRVEIYFDDAVGGDLATKIEDEVFDPGIKEATFVHSADPGGYYIAKVIQIGDHADDVWTSPIWLTDILNPDVAGPVTDPTPGNTDDPPREEIEWEDAVDYIGKTVTVSGKIIRAHNHQGKIVFFNFDPDFRDTLSIILLDDDFATFGGPDALIDRLVNKRVKVRGEITLFQQSRMQIKLTDLAQIVSVEGE